MNGNTAQEEPEVPAVVKGLVSPRALQLLKVAKAFIRDECIPADRIYHQQISTDPEKRWKSHAPVIDKLKSRARQLGLWNLFLPRSYTESPGLSNVEYALIAELSGTSVVAPEAMNCSAPDTGNMEMLAKYGSPTQKERWLKPLLEGQIRSAFAMTEPEVASSDATNICARIRPVQDGYIIDGHKAWISGAGDPRCQVYLLLGRTDTRNGSAHQQQSIVIIPAETAGVRVIRPYTLFGYDDAPHGHMEMLFEKVFVPKENMILGEGRGFEIIQGRLGPGRIHHCMRTIGAASKALDLMIDRVTSEGRRTFGKQLSEHGTIRSDLAEMRIKISASRVLVLEAAARIDQQDAKYAMAQIAMAKVEIPRMALWVIDRAQQAFGAAGIGQDTPLPYLYASIRTLRYADGPDEVHIQQLGRAELKRRKHIAEILKHQTEAFRALEETRSKL